MNSDSTATFRDALQSFFVHPAGKFFLVALVFVSSVAFPTAAQAVDSTYVSYAYMPAGSNGTYVPGAPVSIAIGCPVIPGQINYFLDGGPATITSLGQLAGSVVAGTCYPATPIVANLGTALSAGSHYLNVAWSFGGLGSAQLHIYFTVAAAAQSCVSAPNACGMTNSGTIVNGVCSASSPLNSSCPAVTVTASLSASPASVAYNSQSTLTWSSVNATACYKTGAWLASGWGATSGSEQTGPLTSDTSYSVQCINNTNANNQPSVVKTVTVTVAGTSTALPDTTPPSVPTGLAAAGFDASTNYFTLSWAPSTDNVVVTGYNVYTDGAFIQSTGQTSMGGFYVAPPGSTHTFAVQAFDGAGNTSGQSALFTYTTPGAPAPVACTSPANACGATASGTIVGGVCSASTPANPAGYGTACTSSANSCSQTNSGTIQCNGLCSATTPSNTSCPVACTSPANACGATRTGTIVGGVCSATAPANPTGYGTACTSSANACGTTATGTINCSGLCSAATPSNPTGYGTACTSSANSCSQTNSGTIQCNGLCSATTPSNNSCPVTAAVECTSPANTCGATRSGTIVGGVCSATTPANPAGYGTACTSSANACGTTAAGTINCSGLCSAATPANPTGYGSACTSSANSCGQTNSGTIQCNGSCSALTPSNTSCPLMPPNSCTSSTNACGATSPGTIVNGVCNAVTPANPTGYGTTCVSAPNRCGLVSSGTFGCSGTCSAVTPTNTVCPPLQSTTPLQTTDTRPTLSTLQAANTLQPTQQTTPTSAQVQAVTVQPTAATTAPTAATITRNLSVGTRGSDVSALQQALINAGYSVPAGATGYFGAQTKSALMAFQRARSIAQEAGTVGPLTRAALSNSAAPAPVTSVTNTPGGSGLSDSQIQSIMSLLESFSVDQATLDQVRAALSN